MALRAAAALALLLAALPGAPAQPTTPLTPGQFTPGTLPRFGSAFYSMNLTAAQLPQGGVLDLSLSRLTANTDMYVSLDGSRPSATSFAYASTLATGRNTILVVAGAGPAARAPCSSAAAYCITIGLYSGLFASSYALFTSLNRTSSALASGVPRSDWLPLSGSYNFYQLRSTSAATAQPRFTFSLTATSGDPDLFVSTRDPYPSATSYCWLASGSGDVVEVLPASDNTGCYCTGPTCTYYVSVLAASGSGASYTIVASEDTGGRSIITLLDGAPQMGALARTEQQLYQFTLPEASAPGRRVEAIVTPLTGDPDLYIVLGGGLPDPSGRNDYQSLAAQGPEDIVMVDGAAPWSTGACADWRVPCTFTLLVSAFTATTYSIQVYSGGQALALSPGVPVEGTIAGGGTNFYTFTPPGIPGETVVLSLAASSGDPDLYVGTTANAATQRPTATPGTYIWAALNYGSDVLSIEALDAAACARAPPPAASGGAAPCAYTLGVSGYGGSNATYTLLARTRSGVPVRLSPGLPLEDVLEASGRARYSAIFDFTKAGGTPAATPAKLEIVVSPESGDPDVYIAVGVGRYPNPANLSSFDYSSLAASGDEDIVLRDTDAAVALYCPGPAPRRTPCVVNVVVQAFGTSAAAYAITSFSLPPNPAPTLRLLENAVGTTGTTFAGDYAYFVYEVGGAAGSLSPISIVVTPLGFNSDPDVCACPWWWWWCARARACAALILPRGSPPMHSLTHTLSHHGLLTHPRHPRPLPSTFGQLSLPTQRPLRCPPLPTTSGSLPCPRAAWTGL
jgi:hypothetical protein